MEDRILEFPNTVGRIAEKTFPSGWSYLTAPIVKPAINRSTKKLYRIAIGTLAMKQPAISEPQK
jgi:hypothetical protein